jgi:hypothetical protein
MWDGPQPDRGLETLEGRLEPQPAPKANAAVKLGLRAKPKVLRKRSGVMHEEPRLRR